MAAGGEEDMGSDGVAVGGRPLEVERQGVAGGGPVVEVGQGLALGDQEQVDAAVVVQVALSQSLCRPSRQEASSAWITSAAWTGAASSLAGASSASAEFGSSVLIIPVEIDSPNSAACRHRPAGAVGPDEPVQESGQGGAPLCRPDGRAMRPTGQVGVGVEVEVPDSRVNGVFRGMELGACGS
jgi:hypothetical protein